MATSTSMLDHASSSAVFSFVFLVFVAYHLLSLFLSSRRLSHIPGPRSTSFSKLWLAWSTYSGQTHQNVADVCQKYGPLSRIGPNDLITDDVEILRRMNASRSPYTKSEWYNATAFNHEQNHVFAERDETRHAQVRTRIIPGYSGRDNDNLERNIDDMIKELCELVQRKYLSDSSQAKPLDLATTISFFTLDVIHTIAFGQPAGFLKTDSDINNYFAVSNSVLPVHEWLNTFPSLERMLRTKWISRKIMPKSTDKVGLGPMIRTAQTAVASHREKKQRDMLGSFLEHGLTNEEAEAEAVLQILAGSDTTATAIRMTLFYIMSNPVAYRKLQREIDEAESKGELSFPVIRYAETQQMKYLEACVREGLRMFPPVATFSSKQVPTGGDTLNGLFVPGGTKIGYCAWGVHHKPEVFGSDADIFRPERWLEANEEQLAKMNRSAELVFGWGKNACLGKSIAWIEMRKTVAELIRRYDMTIINPERPFKSVCRNGLFVQTSMFVRIEQRSKS